MAINATDIKILESQRLTDESDGGGRATGKPVVSGDINNLFPDISRLDRTVGRVNLRKLFTGVLTDNDDTYLGAHLICTEAPADPNVSLVMFNTDSQTDTRRAAQDRIESYVVKAVQAPLYLLGHQLAGQRGILCVQRIADPIPEIGDIYVLQEGTTEQYIKVQRLETSVQTFVYEATPGNFVNVEMRQVAVELVAPLKTDFTGGRVTPVGVTAIPGYGTPASVLSTQVADAARYYGVSKLTTAATPGTGTVQVKSIYSPIVPSAQQEAPLVDQEGSAARDYFAPTGEPRVITQTYARVAGTTSRAWLTTPALPGSVSLNVEGGTWVDNGGGLLLHSSGANNYSKISIDYRSGAIDLTRTSSYFDGSASATYTPAVPVAGRVVSNRIDIELANRQRNYTLNLANAKPKRGTLIVDYRALGKWQRLTDGGAGTLGGSGTGSINYDSGSVILTLDAMPDVGSALIYNYLAADGVVVTARTAELTLPSQRLGGSVALLAGRQIVPGSVTLQWLSGGVTRTATDNSVGGLTGDGVGTISYQHGWWYVAITQTPDTGTTVDMSYQHAARIHAVETLSVDANGDASFVIAGAPLSPGSVALEWHVTRKHAAPAQYGPGGTFVAAVNITDNGAGGFIGPRGVGASINYSTGAVTVKILADYSFVRREYSNGQIVTVATTERETLATATITQTALDSGVSGTSDVQNLSPGGLKIALLPAVTEPLLPGSVVLQWGSDTYIDRAGVLYKQISTTTNAGLVAGSVDYEQRSVTIDSVPGGVSNSISLLACATAAPEGLTVKELHFRTPGAPIAVGSLQLTAQGDTGATLTASADFNGNISGDFTGHVDIATGMVQVTFASAVLPASIRYNCVVLTTIPLDAALIGLDPVRLPSDGRVPVFRQGDVVVLSHTQTTHIGTPTAGQVVDVGRVQIAQIEITDSNGLALDPAQYSENREAGTVTFTDPLVLQAADTTALTPPLTLKDRIEHMSMLSDVQINGDLTLVTPVAHSWPETATVVSSAVLYGDTQARLSDFFTQKTWTNVWGDGRLGDDSTAKFNTINYPPTVTNRGAITERWALVFTSSTAFNIVGESIGIIGVGTVGFDTAPINPETGVPYFMLQGEGWGAGWVINNVVRFNTHAALNPAWLIRVIKPGVGTAAVDGFKLQARGDAD